MSRLLRFIPLLVLAAFVVAVAWRLSKPAEEEIRSQLVGQPVPAFSLEPALPGRAGLASTALNEMGVRPDVIERQLAHVERNKVRAAYNHAQYLPERRQMMQAWADHIAKLAMTV